MQPRVRNALIFLLTLGLLGVFLRSVDLSNVWAETRRANPLPLLLAVAITGVPGTSVDTLRTKAAKEVFAKHPDIKIVAEAPGLGWRLRVEPCGPRPKHADQQTGYRCFQRSLSPTIPGRVMFSTDRIRESCPFSISPCSRTISAIDRPVRTASLAISAVFAYPR